MLRIHEILVRILMRIQLFSSVIFKNSTKKNFSKFFVSYFLKVHFHHFPRMKVIKKSLNSRNQNFSYYFCFMIKGSGSISLTNGSKCGLGMPKNIWILRIRTRIQIRNTAFKLWKKYITPQHLFIFASHFRDHAQIFAENARKNFVSSLTGS